MAKRSMYGTRSMCLINRNRESNLFNETPAERPHAKPPRREEFIGASARGGLEDKNDKNDKFLL